MKKNDGDGFELEEKKKKKSKTKKRKAHQKQEETSPIEERDREDGDVEREEEDVSEKEKEKEKKDKKDKKKKKRKTDVKRDKWGQPLPPPDAVDDTVDFNQEHQFPALPEPQQANDSGDIQYEPNKICASGMPYSVTEDSVFSFFSECGTIKVLDCLTFADTGNFKGLAFITFLVCRWPSVAISLGQPSLWALVRLHEEADILVFANFFKSEDAVTKALEMDGAEMEGRFIKVERCKNLSNRVKREGKVFENPPKKVQGCLSAFIGNLSLEVQQIDVKRFLKGCAIKDVRLVLNKTTGKGFGHVDFSNEESLEKAIKMDQKHLLGRPIRIAYAVPNGKKGQY